MKLLVTAGNTQTPLDRVRCITNIFTGRTGAAIARCAHERGHAVTLLTSDPKSVDVVQDDRWSLLSFRTNGDLHELMSDSVRNGSFDAVIHCAAVSDYLVAGIYAPAPETRFLPEDGIWTTTTDAPTLLDRAAGKIKSDEPELWIRLTRAPKLVDQIRSDWGFRGLLVKFKLEVGVDDDRLLEIAEQSRLHSAADIMVANTLEGSSIYAFIGPIHGSYERVGRGKLAERLLIELESRRGSSQ